MITLEKHRLDESGRQDVGGGIDRTLVRGEAMEFIRYIYRGGSTFPVHEHPSEQITVVEQGRIIFRDSDADEGTRVEVSSGELVVIPPDEPHGAFVPHDCEETVTYNFFSPVRDELPGGDVE